MLINPLSGNRNLLCSQTLCPKAGTCYRVKASSQDLSSRIAFPYTISERGVDCVFYIPLYTTIVSVTDSTTHPLKNKLE